jgi:hypothetical protein
MNNLDALPQEKHQKSQLSERNVHAHPQSRAFEQQKEVPINAQADFTGWNPFHIPAPIAL